MIDDLTLIFLEKIDSENLGVVLNTLFGNFDQSPIGSKKTYALMAQCLACRNRFSKKRNWASSLQVNYGAPENCHTTSFYKSIQNRSILICFRRKLVKTFWLQPETKCLINWSSSLAMLNRTHFQSLLPGYRTTNPTNTQMAKRNHNLGVCSSPNLLPRKPEKKMEPSSYIVCRFLFLFKRNWPTIMKFDKTIKLSKNSIIRFCARIT